MYFFQSLFFKTAFSLFILCVSLPSVFAKDNIDNEVTRLKLEQKSEDLVAQQKALIKRYKEQLAEIPLEPEARADEPLDVRQRRERRAKLVALLNDIENKIAYEEKTRRRYIGSTKDDPAVISYVARLEQRVAKHGTDNPFKINGLTRYGKVNLSFLIHEDGKFELIQAKGASVKGLSEHAVKLMQQLAPFEPFPPEVAAQGNRMTFSKDFNFTNE
jgi:hypothetical protein